MTPRFVALLLIALALNLNSSSSLAEGWGNAEGHIVLDGDIPELSLLVDDGNVKVPDDSRIFDAETQGIANVAIYLRKAPAIHPDLREPKEPVVQFVMRDMRFHPHMLIVRTDQRISVDNQDACAHNFHPSPFSNVTPGFLPLPKGGPVEMRYPKPEPLPVKCVCDLHSWMLAWWIVVDHPYAAVTNKKGKFRIEKLPAGEHSFRVWHERTGYINRKLTVTIEADRTTRLEPISVPVQKFH